MKKILLLCSFLVMCSPAISQTGSVEGNISDKETSSKIQDVYVFLENTQFNTQSDEDGHYIIKEIPVGNYILIISFPGFKIISREINIISGNITKVNEELTASTITTGEIIVTSQRYKSRLKDVSLPMEVVDKYEIQKSTAQTVSELLDKKSGLSLTRDGIWATDISIRGLSKNNIVTLIDGDRIETANDLSARLSMIDLNDIERVEVIKGGASSLYGTGAFGGIVNIFSKNAFYNSKFYIKGFLSSSYNSVNNNGIGNISINTGAPKWYLKLAGSFRNAKNTETPDGEIKNSRFSDNSFSGSLGITPVKNHEFKLQYQRFYAWDVGIPGGGTLFPSIASVRYPKEKREMVSGEYSIKNISAFLPVISLKYFYQTILRDVEVIPYQVVTKPGQRVSLLKLTPNARHYTNGIQLQSDWKIGKINHLVAGIDLWKRNLDSRRERFQKIEILDSVTHNIISTTYKTTGEKPIPESDYTSLGIYIQNETRLISEKLKLTYGGRIDEIRTTNEITNFPEYEIINNGIRNYSPSGQIVVWDAREIKETSWSANLGILYHTIKNIDFTFNTGRSFRSPSLEERYQYIDLGNLVRAGNPDLVAEKGIFFDAGLRVWEDKMNISGNLFLNLFSDLVAEIPGTFEGRPAYIKTNIGKARYYGFDIDFIYNIYKQFVVYGNLAYVRGEDTEKNTDLPQVPPLNVILGFKAPLFRFFIVDFSTSVFAEQNKIAAGENSTPGYATFDIGIFTIPVEYQFLKFQFSGGAENILNKSYRNHLATNRGLITSEPGRNFYLKVNVGW